MYSYSVISIHPQTFCAAVRGYYHTYHDAVKALRDEATDYITKYKRYQTVVYINNNEEMDTHPDVKFFLKISDQYPNRVEVYERRKIIEKGWLWNGKKSLIDLIKIFDVISSNMPQENGVQVPIINDYQWVNTIQKQTTSQKKLENLSQIKMMDELREALRSRRKKFKNE